MTEERPIDREALGKALGDALRGASVLDKIEDLTGARSRVFLRDAPTEDTPVLLPGLDAKDDSRYMTMGELARGGVGVIY